MAEKRKHERLLLLSFFTTFERENDLSLGYLANISRGGLMLISKTPIETEVSISMRIEIPEEIDETKELKLVAKSVRCMKDTDLDYFNIGFQVESVSETDLDKYEKLMSIYTF